MCGEKEQNQRRKRNSRERRRRPHIAGARTMEREEANETEGDGESRERHGAFNITHNLSIYQTWKLTEVDGENGGRRLETEIFGDDDDDMIGFWRESLKN
ncbi:hypothetical protein RND81_14G199500 [Saponaria officinalis]|uniref:Uncharacterized protein n=1 Tax=Saponaria officinalis TaxID=3572 RepID=A0AAW1GP84_SAPOF